MNKILLISSSSPNIAPFLSFYTCVLEQNNISYDLLFWNRDHSEEVSKEKNNYIVYDKTYNDFSSPVKKLMDTFRFNSFCKKVMKTNVYSGVICFTIQTSFLLCFFLIRKYKSKYIFDIRDYSKVLDNPIFRIIVDILIKNSYATAISSEGFKQWLPDSNKYFISHNIDSSLIKYKPRSKEKSGTLRILTIGQINRFEPNDKLMAAFSSHGDTELIFAGYGPYYQKYIDFCKENRITNVFFLGRYRKADELSFYENTDMVNILFLNYLNSDTLMSNRFYNAVVCRKPIIVNSNSYQAALVEKYHLGIVIDDYNNLDQKILTYYYTLDRDEFEAGCKSFLDFVSEDNKHFSSVIHRFCKSLL